MNGDDIPGMFVYGAIEPAKGFIVIIERDEDACDLLAGDVTPVCFIDQLLQHALRFSDPTEPGIIDRQPCIRLIRPLLRRAHPRAPPVLDKCEPAWAPGNCNLDRGSVFALQRRPHRPAGPNRETRSPDSRWRWAKEGQDAPPRLAPSAL